MCRTLGSKVVYCYRKGRYQGQLIARADAVNLGWADGICVPGNPRKSPRGFRPRCPECLHPVSKPGALCAACASGLAHVQEDTESLAELLTVAAVRSIIHLEKGGATGALKRERRPTSGKVGAAYLIRCEDLCNIL